MTVYLEAVQRAMPRLLARYNADDSSSLAGVGDRFYWGWKLIDFPNGSFQAAAHGLAILVSEDILPPCLSRDEALVHICRIFRGLRQITARNGSLDEAFPNESSYCVTALVAADALAACELLRGYLDADEHRFWLEAVEPLIGFLNRQDEGHALISNHLASGALAMYRWHAASGDSLAAERGHLWLSRILDNQSTEGWFNEYGGADPGYQSWCTTQLAQLHGLRPDLELMPALERSLEFLTHAAHPDGSFGGVYGSRNTRFLLPGGLELLAGASSCAKSLAVFARASIAHNRCVTLDCIDAGNLIPFFNDYALAALAASRNPDPEVDFELPCKRPGERRWFAECGWLVDSGPRHYSIVNLNKGAASVHFVDGARVLDDPGFVARDAAGRLFTGQMSRAERLPQRPEAGDEIVAEFRLIRVRRPVPGALDFIVLRILSLTVMKSLRLGNWVKKLLAYWLIFRKPGARGLLTRRIILGERFRISDSYPESEGLQPLDGARHFSAIHMASQGYWQRGDGERREAAE